MSTDTSSAASPTYDPFVQSALDLIKKETEQANNLADKVIHADNGLKLLHEVRDEKETTDENILKYRHAMEQMNLKVLEFQTKIEEYILANNLVDNTPVDVPAVTEEYKTIKARVKAMLSVVSSLPGGAEAVKDITPVKGIPGTRASSSGGGTGVRRPRVSSVKCNGEDIFIEKDGKNVTNMTVLATHLSKELGVKVESGDLRDAMFAAAKTEDLSTLNGAPFSFSVSLKDSEGADHTYGIDVVPSVKEA